MVKPQVAFSDVGGDPGQLDQAETVVLVLLTFVMVNTLMVAMASLVVVAKAVLIRLNVIYKLSNKVELPRLPLYIQQ